MLLTIAILSGIGMLLSIFNYVINEDRVDVNLLFAAIFVIVTWSMCFPLAMIAITICILFFIANIW
jgi:hypothetical protein